MSFKKKVFDKYQHYLESVQGPKADVYFIKKEFFKIKKSLPKTLREDFCFTFALCIEWVKSSPHHFAYGIDIDPKCLEYGKKHYLKTLSLPEQKRIKIKLQNVLAPISFPLVDISLALNFSYFVFKTRDLLKKYFKQCFLSLKNKGILVLDCFGGEKSFSANIEKRNYGSFMYYWEQKKFDPISHFCQFRIHYKPKGKPIRKNVFRYDWRLWTLPEINDLLKEVGFKKIHIYWEGTKRDGSGNGIFKPRKKGEECDAFVAYIFAEKTH